MGGYTQCAHRATKLKGDGRVHTVCSHGDETKQDGRAHTVCSQGDKIKLDGRVHTVCSQEDKTFSKHVEFFIFDALIYM